MIQKSIRNLLALLPICFLAVATSVHAEREPLFQVMDAGDRGTTIQGDAKATLTPTYDGSLKKDVLEFDYRLSPNSSAAVWTKNYPSGLNASSVGTLQIGVKVPSVEQVMQLSVSAEIRGSEHVQTIPLPLKAGWSFIEKRIDWPSLGELREVALVVTSAEGVPLARGTLSLALDFLSVSAVPLSAAAKSAEALPAAGKMSAAVSGSAPKSTPEKKAVSRAPAKSAYNLLDAGERGTDVTGEARGNVMPTFDEAAGKDILEFDYHLSPGASIKVWTRSYPLELAGPGINTVKLGIRLLDSAQAKQVAMVLEVKGSKAVQRVPLQLKTGWNSLPETIDWAKIGELEEVAFVVAPKAGVTAKELSGTVNLSVDFIKVKSPGKPGTSLRAAPGFNLFDAGEKGVFNIGDSKGEIRSIYDEEIARDVWAFDYVLPPASIVGIWTKGYPDELDAAVADAVKINVDVPNAEQINQVAVKLEIKGDKSMQSVPLFLHAGRNCFREPVNWNAIGTLSEVVFVVSPMAVNPDLGNALESNPMGGGLKDGVPALTGTLTFELEFEKLTFLQKNMALIKVGSVALTALLLSLIVLLCKKMFGHSLKDGELFSSRGKTEQTASAAETPLSRVKWDLFYGFMVVLSLGTVLKIYALGMTGYLDAGFGYAFLGIGFLGVVIAGLLKYRFAGKALTPSEIFQNLLLSGLLAASSSQMQLLQAPASWNQLFMINHLTAAVTFALYHGFNAYSLATSGKHLKAVPASLIVGTPYLFGWLLLLENVAMIQLVLTGMTGGLLAAWPAVAEVLARLLVAMAFNEVVVNGISLVTKGKLLKESKAHVYIFVVSLCVVIAPLIAHLGSTAWVAALPIALRGLIAVATTALSFAGLWGEVYLITGVLLDGGHHLAPTTKSIFKHVDIGMRKAMAYSGILMAILYVFTIVLTAPAAVRIMSSAPIVVGLIAGALLFPFLKTIIETFDGSLPFFERVCYSYKTKTLYARGAVVGFGFACMISQGLFQKAMPDRILFGLMIGLLSSGGMSFIRDAVYALKGQGKVQSWRLYLVDSLLGVFVGSAAAFYLDSSQVPVIMEKFKLYTSSGLSPVDYITYPLVNKWGRIDLGSYTGGVKLIFLESLAGVINWSVAAWLFAINKVFMQAFFDKDKTPIKFFFSKDGFAMLVEHMIYVLRWGLWMSPIIFTFLRMMPEPTWYNQDGAIRTLFAIYHNFTMTPQAFQAWSLQMFIYVMALDLFRILIWMDHMGLRVATLVNLSFLGMDKLDEKVSRFIGSAAAQRYIPEGVKRFTTWGPLLIPFYLPRGRAWDYAWSTSEAMQNASRNKGLIPALQSLSMSQMVLLAAGAILVCTGFSFLIRAWSRRLRAKRIAGYAVANRDYRVTLKENGEVFSEVLSKEFFDVTRRSYDQIDPCGRIFYLVDAAEPPQAGRSYWPIAGNFPAENFSPSAVERGEDVLKISNFSNGIKAMVEIGLPDQDSTAEVWTITLQNLTPKQRQIKMVPYLEWVLNGWIHDRFHTQYARLYPEMEYVSSSNAILSWHKATKSMGFIATDLAPEGFLSGRVDFIGRARSIWSPRIFETMAFLPAKDTAPYPTFDPIGSLMVNVSIGPKGSATLRMVIGYAKNKKASLDLIQKFLKPRPDRSAALTTAAKRPWLIGHGEIPPGTPQPYSSFADQGNKLVVHTPYTPRPIDHALSNAVHSVMVTNRGLHTSCNGNSQQNRLTPDWADTVTREIPSEAIYLYDPDSKEWFSPTFFPLSDPSAKYISEFSVDGTAVFHMNRGSLATELTVFVPPTDSAGIYFLTVKNRSNRPRRMRVAPYFQMVLGFMPEKSGPLNPKYDKELNALFFENPRNIFRSGPAFASMSIPSLCVETKRGRFYGSNRGVKHPLMVEQGSPDAGQQTDEAQIAGFLGLMEIPANGEFSVAVILGQTENRKQADAIIRKYKDIESVRKSVSDTRRWWLSLMGTLEVSTDSPDFDYYQNWLKYQAVAERIWPRRGYYQTSGAYGFRDQLQDTINLMWVDPALARKQILLCASQQFLEGDVFHWFFTLTDGRSAFSCRSHASDNPLWLAWATAEYIRGTGDESVLDELTPYMHSEFPFAPLPKNKAGWGHLYHRTTRGDTVYRHCLRSIDLVIEKRSGKNGLPLMGTGDWNDGLDEIGSEGKGESVWLGFFLYYILKGMVDIIEKKDGPKRREYYVGKMNDLKVAIEKTWREDRYLRAFHDDGTEIGVKGSGIWEIDALTAAWAVMSGINFERGVTVFNTALSVLEKDDAILLGWPALREDTKPYLGRSSKYPEGVRENGMYCHGVQWLVRAARIIAEQYEKQGNRAKADEYCETAYRLWLKISPISHMTPELIEIYGGQPNKQSADVLTNFERGRMIWHGYTGAAGWMLRQAMEGIVGATLTKNEMSLPSDFDRPRGRLRITRVHRDTSRSPLTATGSFKRSAETDDQGNGRGRFAVLAPEVTTSSK